MQVDSVSCNGTPRGQGFFFSFKDFVYLFLNRREEKERGKNINVWLTLARPLLGTWPATQARALTRNRTSDLSVLRPVLRPLSHTWNLILNE